MIDREILKRAGVSDGDIKGLDQAWDAFRFAAAREMTKLPCIVCTGIYNAGKSSLGNFVGGWNFRDTAYADLY